MLSSEEIRRCEELISLVRKMIYPDPPQPQPVVHGLADHPLSTTLPCGNSDPAALVTCDKSAVTCPACRAAMEPKQEGGWVAKPYPFPEAPSLVGKWYVSSKTKNGDIRYLRKDGTSGLAEPFNSEAEAIAVISRVGADEAAGNRPTMEPKQGKTVGEQIAGKISATWGSTTEIAAAIDAAVQAETERCLGIIESTRPRWPSDAWAVAIDIGTRIRASSPVAAGEGEKEAAGG